METKVNDVMAASKEDCDPIPQQRNGMVQKRRRNSEEGEDGGPSKKPKLLEKKEINLDMLPDDVLLIILSHLESDSLIRLKDTCTVFARLCEYYTFWRKVHFQAVPATVEDVETIARLVHSETKYIKILGRYVNKDTFEDTLSVRWFEKIRSACYNLEVLALPNHFINCQTISMSCFPPSITCLDLSGTRLRNLPVGRSYFRDISVIVPNIKTLILSNCDWFEPHSLMAISKCRYLEELRLNDCALVKDCLAYCGLSTRGGFRSLKVLDLRRCLVTTSELVCFSSVPTLKVLFLENVNLDGQYPVIFIDPAIMVLCTRNEMQVAGGVRALAPRPHLLVERLTVRHFQTLTDITLSKLARDAHSLRYLDVTGTGVTKAGIEKFRMERPYVKLVHDVFYLEE